MSESVVNLCERAFGDAEAFHERHYEHLEPRRGPKASGGRLHSLSDDKSLSFSSRVSDPAAPPLRMSPTVQSAAHFAFGAAL